MIDKLMAGGIAGILEGANKLIDTFYTSDEEKQKYKMELLRHHLDVFKAQQAEALGQMEINKMEAQHKSVFVSGWRPFVGWVCGAGLAYAVLLHHLLNWVLSVGGYPSVAAPDTSILMTTLMGMLGMAGFRTYEKMKGVARK